MNSIKQLLRLLHINYVLAKNGLDQVIVSLGLFSAFRFVVYLNPWNWLRRYPLTRGQALRKALEELGPIFVKFGQALSTRPDILPPDIAKELCHLQDNVAPFSSDIALSIIEETFGVSAYEVFGTFDDKPLASASISQVHAATLKTGEQVVVKILRPNMHKIIQSDLDILNTIAKFADKYWPESKRLKPKEIVQEFARNILDELDLQREAANAAQLRRNFNHSPLLYIPEIYWDYIHENIMVMERIYGIPVTDIAELNNLGVDMKKLAERGLEIFFTQVFRDCFFHADMHPGNIFVSPLHPNSPQYICVDFGIIGTLGDSDKRYLAENLLAFFNRDYRRVAELHIESGWVSKNTRADEFESAIRTVCEPLFEKPLKDISFALIILKLFQVARRFNMEVQPQLVLLQKTLFAVEGLGRQIYPELNLWTTAKPFIETWLRDQMGPRALIRNLRENLPFFIEQLPYMPKLMNDVFLNLKDLKSYSLENKKTINLRKIKKKSWFLGMSSGFFIAMSIWGILGHFNWLSYDKLTIAALSAALVSGFILALRA